MVPKQLKIKCSAPGKIILHGEHSVVYNKLAIAASLDLRTTVTIEERLNNKIDINFIDLGFKRYIHLNQIKQVFATTDIPIIDNYEDENASLDNIFLYPDLLDHDKFIEKIRKCLNLQENTLDKNKYSSLISLLYLYFGIVYSSKIPIEAICVTIKTELSLGSGTGSSASFMVSLASAFIQYLVTKSSSIRSKFEIDDSKTYDQFNEFQLKLISKWGFAAERIIHGNPSGIDNTVCTYGSIVSFRKGRAPFAVKCNREIKGLLVDTKVPKNTAIQVQKVAHLKQRHPKIVECVLEAMEHLTEEALDLLIQLGDDSIVNVSEFDTTTWYTQLGELASLNHNLLRTLGVSHPALDKTVDLMTKKKLHGKLTGAGGGGYAIALVPPDFELKDLTELCLELNAQGFKTMITKLGGFGTRFED